MIIGISGYVGNRLTGIGRVLINILSELAKQYPEDKYVLFRNFDFKEYDNLTQYQNIERVRIEKYPVAPMAIPKVIEKI